MKHTAYTVKILAALLLIAFLAWGCAPMTPPVKSADMLSTPNLLVEADAAWRAERWEAVELYYAAALERSDLVRSELPTIYSRLAEGASQNGHYHQARIALEQWANLDTSALERADWERLYLDAMAALGKTERLNNHLQWVLGSATVPWETRQVVALWYGEYYRTHDDPEQAMEVLGKFYEQAPDNIAKSLFEQEFSQRLSAMDDVELSRLAMAVTPANQWRFPYALAAFELGVRKATEPEAWSASWRTLRDLAASGELADLIPLQNKLAELEARFGLPRIGLALALPVTGPYAKVGVKILRGAGLAQWQLAQEGVDVELKVINTEAPGWESRLANLPAHFTVVGGPLRVDAFKRFYESDSPAAGVLKKRAVFAFLSSLGDLAEGRDAWRFFTSHNDEVRSLVRLTVERLGITDLAVFYPEEKFGRAMAQTFYEEAAPLGGQIKGMQSYPSRAPKQWTGRVGKLLNVPSDFSNNKDVPLPMPDFGAVFIPDGWRQAQTLLPNFFFYEGDQLVFLGPGLWSRALNEAKDVDEHYYRLAVCPGAWWDASEGGKALQSALTEEGLGQADFWVALGYDFLRFAGRFGSLPASWDSDLVNGRIGKAADMEFSMAPMAWDENGTASQDLYLFTPASNGKRIVDPDKLAERIARAQARREKRMENYEKRLEEEGKAVSRPNR
ncbi:hypothetical protein LF599_05480 [Pseudodesulfovibrio thermohalotolerans]|uniref:hypothetical protein n=1 Tax=Pseudodesulfovibrio thermohalotolerans TaxID=2880651 RepID=UPI002442739F|nr:hypothetical protein [Pseudodesulfovibrio thermohalotolerans]WFS63616.1 hypothetical protein LF599_05480 [Pseudodesulfovibrio thermohalotolerans]